MAKFYLTNDLGLFDKVNNLVEESEFKPSFSYAGNGIYALATHKLREDNVNAYKEGEDFLIATGTLIFKGGNDLKEVFDNYSDPISNQDDTLGGFCIAKFAHGLLRVSCDVMSGYDVFYYHNNNEFFISNSLYDMAVILKERLTVNSLNIVEYVAQNNIINNETFFNEIFRLFDDFIEIDIKKNTFSTVGFTLQYPMCSESSDDCAKKMAERLKKYAASVVGLYGRPDMCMTGGLDARTVLASFISTGVLPNLHYGVGNSYITGTNTTDLDIDRLLKERYGMSLREGNWQTPEPFDRDWDYYITKYGFDSLFYGTSGNVIKFYESMPERITATGQVGEMYRTLEWADSWNKPFFTLDEFLDSYYLRNDILLMTEHVEGYKEHIRRKLKHICDKYSLDENRIAIEDYFYFLLEYRKRADMTLMNFLNKISYSCYLLYDRVCLQAARLSCEDLRGSSFMLKVINQIEPSLLDIPVYSHGKLRTLDKDNLKLMPLQLSINDRVKAFLPQSLKNHLKRARYYFRKTTALDNCVQERMQTISMIPGLSFKGNTDKRAEINYMTIERILDILSIR